MEVLIGRVNPGALGYGTRARDANFKDGENLSGGAGGGGGERTKSGL